ncbi:MAG: TIGR01620 family protein [Rhizobiales bacterium]|nr:TIGR01620 family protein [Hyphomicrobiales bacterium]
MARSNTRQPASFDLDDPSVRVADRISAPELEIDIRPAAQKEKSQTKKSPIGETTSQEAKPTQVEPTQVASTVRLTARFSRWGGVLLTSLGALVGLAAGLAATELVESLFARAEWLGWVAVGFAALAAFALIAIIVREITSLARLRKLGRIRDEAARASKNGSERDARMVIAKLKQLYRGRPDCSWQLARLADAAPDIFDAADLMKISERILMKDLDDRAKAEIAQTAKRVSVVTAVSPAALIDIGFVLVANLSLMRKLAALYGGRPGTFGMLKLARMVLTHLTLTGGIALGDSFLQQIFGHGVAARLSARLGEGVLNGLFTSRIGLAALEVCRPLPFTYLPSPAIKDLMSEVIKPGP